MSSEENLQKMKSKKYPFGKVYKEYPHTCISFYTRYMSGEVLFGNPEEEEENIAVSILRSIKKVNTFICNLLVGNRD